MSTPVNIESHAPRVASRSTRILGAVGFGYLSQLLTVSVGLWLTPFLLHRLGQRDYGLWLLAMQMTAYMALLDLGVVALLPRETSYVIGRAGGNKSFHDLPDLIGRTIRIVLCQLPIVALVAGVVLWMLPGDWRPLRGPFTLIVGVFLVMFPLRVLHAILQGLQELPFLGAVALSTWIAGTITTVSLVLAGMGLYAVAAGWAVSQFTSALWWWLRIRERHANILPRRLPRVTAQLLHEWLRSGVWVSVAQVAQVLLSGTDLLIIGTLLGPAAIVPYAITGKLIAVLANQPQMVMQAAQPALSEIKATHGERHRLIGVTTALTQLMLMISGAVFVVTLVVNQGFVGWWIDPKQYAGLGITLALLGNMLLRHWNTTTTYAIFAFGNERRIAITTLADGVLTIMVSAILVLKLGVVGVVIGSMVGVCVVSLPANLTALRRDTEASLAAILLPLVGWLARLLLLVAIALAVVRSWSPKSLASLVGAAVLAAVAYAATMAPLALRPPLGEYLRPRIRALSQRLPYLRANAN